MNPDRDALLQSGQPIAASVLPAVFAIFDRWGLTSKEQAMLLGLRTQRTLNGWKNSPEKIQLSRDLLERVSYILGIYKSLQTLFPSQMLADGWLKTPNDNPKFNGAQPLDWRQAGLVIDLAAVRSFLLGELQ